MLSKSRMASAIVKRIDSIPIVCAEQDSRQRASASGRARCLCDRLSHRRVLTSDDRPRRLSAAPTDSSAFSPIVYVGNLLPAASARDLTTPAGASSPPTRQGLINKPAPCSRLTTTSPAITNAWQRAPRLLARSTCIQIHPGYFGVSAGMVKRAGGAGGTIPAAANGRFWPPFPNMGCAIRTPTCTDQSMLRTIVMPPRSSPPAATRRCLPPSRASAPTELPEQVSSRSSCSGCARAGDDSSGFIVDTWRL